MAVTNRRPVAVATSEGGDGDDDRRARALKRLAELNDEPGGEQFLARMGALGDWIVDFAFGDVHTRPGLPARERELIIVAVLTTLGSSDPQVRGAHPRAARDRRTVDRDRGDDPPDDAVRWHPACGQRDQSAPRGTGGRSVKAVRFENPDGRDPDRRAGR